MERLEERRESIKLREGGGTSFDGVYVQEQPSDVAKRREVVSGKPLRWFMINVRAWCAGELEGSANAFCQATMSRSPLNSTVEKMCFRLRAVHDFETMEHALSAPGWSRSWSMMESQSSGGSLELADIVGDAQHQPVRAPAEMTPLAPGILLSP